MCKKLCPQCGKPYVRIEKSFCKGAWIKVYVHKEGMMRSMDEGCLEIKKK